jgi:single-strand DNA-binding protein
MLNKVQLIGNITHELEKQYINSKNEQIPKIDFNLAINNKDRVQFVPCVVFHHQAENMSTYLHKGSKIYAEGNLYIQKYTNNTGQMRTTIKVIIQNIIFLDKKTNKRRKK